MTEAAVALESSNRAPEGDVVEAPPSRSVAGYTEAQRQALVLKHYDLVKAVACKVYHRLPKVVELDDLISAGVTGLIEAIDRYDPARSVPFEIYAKPRIQGSILDTLRNQDWVPRSVRRKHDLINQSRNNLREKLGRSPNREEMAAYIDVTTKKLDNMVKDSEIRSLLSLDAPVGNDNPTPLVEQVGNDDNMMARWQKAELKDLILVNLQRLPERERTAVSLYYLHELSLKEVGKVLGVTESRACQLCSQGIKRLRFKLRNHVR